MSKIREFVCIRRPFTRSDAMLAVIGQRITLNKPELKSHTTKRTEPPKMRKYAQTKNRSKISSDNNIARVPTDSSIPVDGSDLLHKLEELRKLYAELEASWNSKIEAKEEEKREIIEAKRAEKQRKLEQLEARFMPQTGASAALKEHTNKLNQQIQQLKTAGKISEAEELMKQVKQIQINAPSNTKFTQMRELQARMTELSKACDRELSSLLERLDIDIDEMQNNKLKELKPISDQIKILEKQLGKENSKARLC